MNNCILFFTKLENKYAIVPLLYAALGCVALTFQQILIKCLGKYIHIIYILYLKAIILITVNTIILNFSKNYVYIKNSKIFRLVILRQFIQCYAVYAFFLPIQYIPLSIINSIWMMCPLFTHFLQSIMMKVKIAQILDKNIDKSIANDNFQFYRCYVNYKTSIYLGETQQTDKLFYCVFVLSGAIANAISFIIMRLYKDGIKNDANLQYTFLSQTINGSINLILFQNEYIKSKIDLNFYILIILVALFSYLNQITFTRAVFLIPAAKCHPFQYICVILGFLSDIFFLIKPLTFFRLQELQQPQVDCYT